MIEVAVNYRIRKGTGPEMVSKVYPTSFDDVPPETSDAEIKRWAIRELEDRLETNEDYPWYGRNWIIGEVEFI